MAVARLAERYAADYPEGVPRPRVELRGYAETGTARAVASRLGEALAIRDVDALIRLVESQDIAPSYERRADGTLVFASALEASTDFRLHRAIERNDPSAVARILDVEAPDLERYAPVRTAYGLTPLLHAVALGRREIVARLLDAGTDPDTRDPGQSMSPLYRAMLDADARTVVLLARADGICPPPSARRSRRSTRSAVGTDRCTRCWTRSRKGGRATRTNASSAGGRRTASRRTKTGTSRA